MSMDEKEAAASVWFSTVFGGRPSRQRRTHTGAAAASQPHAIVLAGLFAMGREIRLGVGRGALDKAREAGQLWSHWRRCSMAGLYVASKRYVQQSELASLCSEEEMRRGQELGRSVQNSDA